MKCVTPQALNSHIVHWWSNKDGIVIMYSATYYIASIQPARSSHRFLHGLVVPTYIINVHIIIKRKKESNNMKGTHKFTLAPYKLWFQSIEVPYIYLERGTWYCYVGRPNRIGVLIGISLFQVNWVLSKIMFSGSIMTLGLPRLPSLILGACPCFY